MAGSVSSSSGGGGGGAANRDRTLELLLTLQDDVSKQIGNIMQTMNTQVEQTSKKWTEKFAVMKDKVFNFSNAIQGALGSAIIKEGIGALKEYENRMNQMTALKLNSKFSGVLKDFEQIGELTNGLATQTDMMTSISKAFSFGIDLSEGRLKDLIDVSKKTAIVMGTDLRTAFDDLITGVSRESMMILDNLGVVVNMSQAKEQYAKSIGKTVDQLTREENKVAILNETTSKLKENLKDIDMNLIANRAGAASRQLEDSLTQLKNFASESFIATGDAVGYFFASIMNQIQGRSKVAFRDVAFEAEGRIGVDVTNAFKVLESQLQRTYYSQDDLNKEIADSERRFNELKQSVDDYGITNDKITDKVTDFYYRLKELKAAIIDIPDSLSYTDLKLQSIFSNSLNNVEEKFMTKFKETADKRASYREKKNQEAIKKEQEFMNLLTQTEENNAKESAAIQEEQKTATRDRLFSEIAFQKQIDETQKGRNLTATEYLDLFRKFDTQVFKVSSSFEALGLVEQTRQEGILEGIRSEIKERDDLNTKIDTVFQNERDKQEQRKKDIKDFRDNNDMQVEFLSLFGINFDSEMSDESLKIWQVHFDQMAEIASVGTGIVTDITNQMFQNFLDGQDIFSREMFGLALRDAGQQIYADGVKNAWVGGGQMIMGLPQGSALFGWGLGEIATGIGMGAAGRSLAPTDNSDGEGEKRKESQQVIQIQMGNLSLYNSRHEAQRAIRAIV